MGRIVKRIILIGYLLFFLVISNLVLINAQEEYEEWENKGLEWYYENLTNIDRKKIRQAMDYAIPRQMIISELMNGLAVPIATQIGQNILGYDANVQPRDYNTTKASQLLTEVFGKTYNINANEENETETKIPYFSIIIVSTTTNHARIQWTMIIAESFRNIGIDVELKWWNWNIIIPRIYLDPIAPGYDYTHGGVDAWFYDRHVNPNPDYSSDYYISSFAPTGENSYWLENKEVKNIIITTITDPDLSDRLNALKNFQEWFYEETPKSIILQEINLFVMNEKLEGFDTYLIGRGWCFNNLTLQFERSLTYTIPGEFVYFNPLLSNNYYDFISLNNVFGALSQYRGSYNLTHPVPQIAESWSQNEDGTVWEVKIRDEIKWSDGTTLTVEDILFTYHVIFEEKLQSPKKGFYLDRFYNNVSDIYLKDGSMDTIVFELKSFYPYVTSNIFGVPILQKAQWEKIPFDNWKTHSLNTGTGPEYVIGCGPYMITDFNTNTGVKLEINQYFDQNIFGHDPNARGGGIYFTNPTLEEIHVVVEKDDVSAITGLSSGNYDIIDPQTGLQAQYEVLNKSGNEYNSKCILALDYGWQGLHYNHYDPRWGMNPHGPDMPWWTPKEHPEYNQDRFYLGLIVLGGSFIIFLFIVISLIISYLKSNF